MLQGFFKGLRSIIFPHNCPICRRGPLAEQQYFCETCLNRIPWVKPTADSAPTGLTYCWSVCNYQEPLIQLIHRYKYQGSTKLTRTLAYLIKNYINTHHLPLKTIDLILPIPLAAQRLRERGFNQSLLLAQEIGKTYSIPVYSDILLRTSMTVSQTTLSLKDRWTNQQGTFRITHPETIIGKHVLIVDDLLTSGATCVTAAFELKKLGASQVSALTLAKA